MMKLQSSILQKGLFALAVVAIAGTVGAIHFAQAATDNTSGYGTSGQQAVAAADTFANSINTCNQNFAQTVNTLSINAGNQLRAGNPVNNFDSQFQAASNQYTAALNNAFDNFVAQANAAANTAESKDQFIDQFNHAKADYLNALDAAKNQFAAAVSPLGDNANQVKDTFMNGFNSSRDTYSNCLEQGKNTFAATVSNL